MTTPHPPLTPLPCIDDRASAYAMRVILDMPRSHAAWLGTTAVQAAQDRAYAGPDGQAVDVGAALELALHSKLSIRPDAVLPQGPAGRFAQTRVQVQNRTTLQAARALVAAGKRPLALNLANGVQPGGGFLDGARAQEESLCRSSLLSATLFGDPMYDSHAARRSSDSTDWLILSPDVPVFREDTGLPLPAPWLLSFVTGAAPYAPSVGQGTAQHLMAGRIRRLLAVAHAHCFKDLVLGAWGCGAFRIDPAAVAAHFRDALQETAGCFDQVVFAISDWSNERRFLGPFRDAFPVT